MPMTEKRFRVTIGKNNSVALIDVVDNVRLIYIQFSNKETAVSCRSSLVHQCELMNTLYEENEQLKQQVAFLEEFIKTGVQYEYYQKIYDENEQLKQFKEKSLHEVYDLNKENEQLKQALEKDIMRRCEIKEAFNERYGDVE